MSVAGLLLRLGLQLLQDLLAERLEARGQRRHEDQVVAVLRLHRADDLVERRRVGGLLELGDERFGCEAAELPPCCAEPVSVDFAAARLGERRAGVELLP